MQDRYGETDRNVYDPLSSSRRSSLGNFLPVHVEDVRQIPSNAKSCASKTGNMRPLQFNLNIAKTCAIPPAVIVLVWPDDCVYKSEAVGKGKEEDEAASTNIFEPPVPDKGSNKENYGK